MPEVYRKSNINILVLGDVNIDTILMPLEQGEWWWHRRLGGAWLLEEIIREAIKAIRERAQETKEDKPGWSNSIEVASYNQVEAGVDRIKLKSVLHKQYRGTATVVGLFPKSNKKSTAAKDLVYRVGQQLGWVHGDKEESDKAYQLSLDAYKTSLHECVERLKTATIAETKEHKQDILVLHDGGKDFRHLDREVLKSALELQYKKDKTWIVWHASDPLLKDGNLWQIIKDSDSEWLKRTILVIKVEDLRRMGAKMPDVISLEQESENFEKLMDMAKDIKPDLPLKRLTEVGHIVVHFRRQGVLHYDKTKGHLETSCYYCPDVSDDPTSRNLGTMLGFTSILVAAIVRGIAWELIHKQEEVSLDEMTNGIVNGIKQGVVLDHLHFVLGYGDSEGENDFLQGNIPAPYERLFRQLTILKNNGWKDERMVKYHLAAIGACEDKRPASWSRIEYFIKKKKKSDDPTGKKWTSNEYTEKIAHAIVRRGLENIVQEEEPTCDCPETPPLKVHCPFEVHGKIKTAFRDEIDSFGSIRRIIEKYLDDKTWPTPLSIAVFGPPGSGKSFTIQQIMSNINADSVKRPLKYNMSQFENPKDLETVFHKIQDEAVAGEVPLVFFDEFDAENLKWLKYFLAPMQDGEFKAGDSTYRTGRAIFVFAGGVAKSWSMFYDGQKDMQNFKAAKGTDFVSRLRGYLDITSINHDELHADLGRVTEYFVSAFAKTDSARPLKSKPGVEVLMFRRAVLLRSLLELRLKSIFDKNMNYARIDSNVIHAFLKIPRYEHGPRSMQAIIEMSRISYRGHFQESSLPALEQLEIHVNPVAFCELLREPIPD